MPTALELEKICIDDCEDFHPGNIFDCGQCFRWNADEHGSYTGVAYGRAARVWREGDCAYIECAPGDFERVWKDYFDLSRNYAEMRREISREERLADACEFGKGIRILRQEPWEALCSFIISQCNNIPRIKGIIERLCAMCGERIVFRGKEYFTFPSAEAVAELSQTELETLRSGYRASYISEAARGVAEGSIDLYGIMELPTEEARSELLKLTGVGEKVANCVLIFGLGKLDAFPIDVWVKRAINEFFGEGRFDYRRLGRYAGLAQQYMFHYIRNGK